MHLNLEGLSPAFNKNTTQYYLVVSNLINDIEVKAVPEDSSCKVEITGNKNLSIGNNKIDIKVISADGSASKIYSINVSKTENKELIQQIIEAIKNIQIGKKTDFVFSDNGRYYTIEYYDGTTVTYYFQSNYYNIDNVNYETYNYDKLKKINIPKESINK